MIVVGLVVVVGAVGVAVWCLVVLRLWNGQPPFGDEYEPHGPRRPRDPLAALLVGVAWFAAQLVVAMALMERMGDPVTGPLMATAAGLLSLFLVLRLLSDLEPQSSAELGLVPRSWTGSIALGLQGFLLAYPGVLGILLLSANQRSRETQHQLITTLQDHPTVTIIVLTVLGAIILAPLVEELVFRVVFQGLLRNWLDAGSSILIASLLFSWMHGWPDSIALIPLALVLGWIYERTNDAWAVVVTHFLFNVFNMALALLVDPEEIERMRQRLEQGALFGP